MRGTPCQCPRNGKVWQSEGRIWTWMRLASAPSPRPVFEPQRCMSVTIHVHECHAKSLERQSSSSLSQLRLWPRSAYICSLLLGSYISLRRFRKTTPPNAVYRLSIRTRQPSTTVLPLFRSNAVRRGMPWAAREPLQWTCLIARATS